MRGSLVMPVLLAVSTTVHGAPLRLTLEEATARALQLSPAVAIAKLAVEEKRFSARAVVSQFFPKVSGTASYLHFSRALGTTLTGPRGAPISIAFLDQDQVIATAIATQPLTPLFSLWMLLDAAHADEQIARAQVEAAGSEAVYDVERAFWALLIAQRQHAQPVDEPPPAAATSADERQRRRERLKQRLELESQLDELTAQLDQLIGEPATTTLVLIAPTTTPPPVPSFDESFARLQQSCPALREANETIRKAQAATRVAAMELGPEVAAIGGWAYQHAIPLVPDNFGFVGVQASWTLLDFGKAYHELRARQAQLMQARLARRVAGALVEGELRKALRTIALDDRLLRLQADDVTALRALPPNGETTRALADAELGRLESERDLRLAHAALQKLCAKTPTPEAKP